MMRPWKSRPKRLASSHESVSHSFVGDTWSGIADDLSVQSPARFAQPSLLPVEQLFKTVETRLKAHPDDAKAHYAAGRIHYLAFYNMAASVSAFSNREPLPSIAPYWTAEANYLHQARRTEATQRALKKMKAKAPADIPREKQRDFWQEVSEQSQTLEKTEWKPPAINDKEAVAHAEKALAAFDKAIRLDRADALNFQSRASLLEQFDTFVRSKKLEPGPKSLSDISPKKIRDAYFDAWAVGLDEALGLKTKPVSGLRSIVSYEAGKAFLRLCKEDKDLPRADTARAAKVEETIAKLDMPTGSDYTNRIFDAPGRGTRRIVGSRGHCELRSRWRWNDGSVAVGQARHGLSCLGSRTQGRGHFGAATLRLLHVSDSLERWLRTARTARRKHRRESLGR
jgi:tetratricopeptide (TPR) repeat protein